MTPETITASSDEPPVGSVVLDDGGYAWQNVYSAVVERVRWFHVSGRTYAGWDWPRLVATNPVLTLIYRAPKDRKMNNKERQ